MVAAGRAHVENGKFSQNGLKMVLGYQGLRPWPLSSQLLKGVFGLRESNLKGEPCRDKNILYIYYIHYAIF